MEDFIATIVAELLELDPKLRPYEKALRELVKKLVASRPDATFDEAFRVRLGNQIKAAAVELKQTLKEKPSSTFNFFIMKKLAYMLAGAFVVVMIILPIWQPWSVLQNVPTPTLPIFESTAAPKAARDLTAGTQIESVAPGAFGDLVTTDNLLQQNSLSANGRGGANFVSNSMVAEKISMPAPEFTQYRYTYSGALNLPVGTVDVLKRKKQSVDSSNLMQVLQSFNLGLLDSSTFKDLKPQTFSFYEDRDFGYLVNVMAEEGTISIDQYWNRWPDPYRDCGLPDCYEALRLQESDMLSDAEVLKIAKAFTEKYSLDLSTYGTPEIENSWRDQLAMQENKQDFYYPDTAAVIYPLEVNGQTAYSSAGDKEGVRVTVNMRQKKVANVWGLMTQAYQSSAYQAVADEALFKKFLERGGLFGFYQVEGSKEVEVPLGEPQLVYLKYYQFKPGENNTELLVPAYLFPILEKPEPYFYQKSVVVPLAAEILQEADQQPSPVLFQR